MRNVLIDTDPGVDDALALIMVFSSCELELEGLTTVVGNVSLEQGSINALKLIDFFNVEGVPVSAGAFKPLFGVGRDASSIHGETGLGRVDLPKPLGALDKRNAVELILEKAKNLGDDLTLIALGPLTNIAMALRENSDVMKEVDRLITMGGAFNITPYGHGNVTPVAEFNIWHDPEAAKIVYDSGMKITAVGLDVTTDPLNRFSKEKLEEIERLSTMRSKLLTDLCEDIIARYGGMNLHDPLAIATFLEPTLVRTIKTRVNNKNIQ